MLNQLRCDFCSTPQVRWCYPARDFIDLGLVGPDRFVVSESIGGWAACDDCHHLIESGEREALLGRSVEKFVQFFGQALPGPAEDIRRIHDQFFAHRCGPAIRVAESPTCGVATPPPHS